MYGVVDANGVKIVQELISAAKNGGGFVQYRMPRLDGARESPKISYAVAVPEWGWYVGAGMYVDDLDAAVAARRASLLRSIRFHVVESSAVLVGLLALILVAAQMARKRLQRNLAVFARFFDQAAWGAARIEPEHVGFLELASLADTANTMIFLRLSAERELRTSEKRYRTIVENLSDALLILSLGGRILDFNENACALFGFTRGELAGADLSLVADACAEAHWREMLTRLFAADSLVFEVECRRKDGTTLHAEVSAKRVTKEGDGVVQAFVRDVSERRQAENALRENESLLRTLMDNMGAGRHDRGRRDAHHREGEPRHGGHGGSAGGEDPGHGLPALPVPRRSRRLPDHRHRAERGQVGPGAPACRRDVGPDHQVREADRDPGPRKARGDFRRHLRAEAGGRGASEAGGPGPPDPEAGEPRDPRRGDRARLQQHPDDGPRQRRAGQGRGPAPGPGHGQHHPDRNRRPPRGRAVPPDAHVFRQGVGRPGAGGPVRAGGGDGPAGLPFHQQEDPGEPAAWTRGSRRCSGTRARCARSS